MEKTNEGPDLTMLALAAYAAIRKNMEEDNGKEKTPEVKGSTQPHDRTASQPKVQTAGYRLITI